MDTKEDQLINQMLANDPMFKGLGGLGQDEASQFASPVLSGAFDKNFLIFSLESEKVIDKIEHQLRNEYYDKNDKKYKSRGSPLINEYGINRLIGLLRPFLDKNFSLSYYDADDIERTIKAIAMAVLDCLYNEWEDFGLISKTDVDKTPKKFTITGGYKLSVSKTEIIKKEIKQKEGFFRRKLKDKFLFRRFLKDKPILKYQQEKITLTKRKENPTMYFIGETSETLEANISAINSVYEIIINNAYSNLLRAKDGFTMKVIRSVYKAEEKDKDGHKGLSMPNPFSKKY